MNAKILLSMLIIRKPLTKLQQIPEKISCKQRNFVLHNHSINKVRSIKLPGDNNVNNQPFVITIENCFNPVASGRGKPIGKTRESAIITLGIEGRPHKRTSQLLILPSFHTQHKDGKKNCFD